MNKPSKVIFLKDNLLYWFAAVTPFYFIFLINIFYLKRNAFNIEFDLELSFFSMALNYITGHDLTSFHQPGYLFKELTGWLVQNFAYPDINNPEHAITKFANIGKGLNLMLIALVGCWVVNISKNYFSKGRLFLLSIIVASMPTIAIFSSHFGPYYVLGILLYPAGITTYLYTRKEKISPLSVLLTFFVLGVIITNMYLYLVICAGLFGMFFVQQAFLPFSVDTKFKYLNHNHWILIFNVILILWSQLFLRKLIPFFVLLQIFSLFLYFKKKDTWKVVEEFLKKRVFLLLSTTSFLVGMIAGANKYSRSYIPTFIEIRRNYFSVPFKLDVYLKKMFIFTVWHYLLIFSLVVVIFFLVKKIKEKRITRELVQNLFLCLIFSVTCYGLANYYSDPWIDNRFGSDSRFVIWSIPMVVCSILLSIDQWGKWIIVLASFVSFLSIGEYAYKLRNRARDVDEFARRIDRQIDDFVAKGGDRQVVCYNDNVPSMYCTTAFSYNRYRTPDSLRTLHTKWLYGNKIYWHGIFDSKKNLLAEMGKEPAEILMVGWDFRFSSFDDFYKTYPGYSYKVVFNEDFKDELDTLDGKVRIVHLTKKDN